MSVASHQREPETHVRFASKADKRADVGLSPLSANRVVMRRSKKAPLFDHLVGAGEQRRRHGEAERLRGSQIL